jgi:hypothetical protein
MKTEESPASCAKPLFVMDTLRKFIDEQEIESQFKAPVLSEHTHTKPMMPQMKWKSWKVPGNIANELISDDRTNNQANKSPIAPIDQGRKRPTPASSQLKLKSLKNQLIKVNLQYLY